MKLKNKRRLTFPRPCLRQIGHNEELLWRSERSDGCPNVAHKGLLQRFLSQTVAVIALGGRRKRHEVSVLCHDKDSEGFASELIGN
jgi:hypothetical protein